MGDVTEHDPKLARLEAVVESLIKDALHLTTVVEKLADRVDVVALPKKTEWQVVGVAGTLLFAIGAAVMGPITWRLDTLQTGLAHLTDEFRAHEKLPLHPVGTARVNALEQAMIVRDEGQTKELDIVRREGTPITAARMSVLESEMRDVQRRLAPERSPYSLLSNGGTP